MQEHAVSRVIVKVAFLPGQSTFLWIRSTQYKGFSLSARTEMQS